MLEVPLYIFIFLYFIFLAIFAAFYLIIIYHIVSSASFTLASFVMSFFIFAVTVLTLYATYELLFEVDWQHTVATLDFRFLSNLLGL